MQAQGWKIILAHKRVQYLVYLTCAVYLHIISWRKSTNFLFPSRFVGGMRSRGVIFGLRPGGGGNQIMVIGYYTPSPRGLSRVRVSSARSCIVYPRTYILPPLHDDAPGVSRVAPTPSADRPPSAATPSAAIYPRPVALFGRARPPRFSAEVAAAAREEKMRRI